LSPRLAVLLAACAFLAACRRDMHDQPRYEPLERSGFFADGRASRPLVPGTVARGRLDEDEHLHRGRVSGELAATFPFPVTQEILSRGRGRYDVFCSPCHGRTGDGDGTVVERGLRRPPSLHVARLREAPVGHHFEVMTRGFGVMYDLADRIPAADRWAIVAYVRALQRSQNATIDDVPESERAALLEAR